MILRAIDRWGITAEGSIMIGDRGSDIVAGKTAGLYTDLIDRHYAEPCVQRTDLTARSLPQAVAQILAVVEY